MKYPLFLKLYNEAKQYQDADMYIAERGWQEWMDQYGNDSDISKISTILFRIHALANASMEESRNVAGYPKRTGFCTTYQIPDPTVQRWEYGTSEMKSYDRAMIDYTFFISYLMDEEIL